MKHEYREGPEARKEFDEGMGWDGGPKELLNEFPRWNKPSLSG